MSSRVLAAYYCSWRNYLHKVIDYAHAHNYLLLIIEQEIIQHEDGPGTVGGLSGEGNEGRNKIFRHFRKHLSRRRDSYGSLRDVVWFHWLYTSPAFQQLVSVFHTQQRCCVFSGWSQQENLSNQYLMYFRHLMSNV